MQTKEQTKDQTKENIQVRAEEIYLEGKYNPGLFLPANRGLDSFCQEMVQRGLDTNETRKYVQRDLLDSKSSRCSELFRDRAKKASDVKFAQIDTCSYCDTKCADASKLHVYFLLVHAGSDPVTEELKKKLDDKTKNACVLKTVVGWSLETKIRDVRSVDPVVINGGSMLLCLGRCDECMKSPKVEVVD